jgi:heat shock protein HslJ
MRAIGALCLLAFALACSSQVDEWLPARTYVMDEIHGKGWYGSFRLRFEDDHTLVASAGCNSLWGPYRLSGGELVVEGLGWNDAGCHPLVLLEQDDWMRDFLFAAPTYEIGGPKLTLTDGDVEIEMVDEAIVDPDRPLMGRDWWIRATSAELEIVVWGYEHTGSIYFDGDDTFRFEGACASGGGNYGVQGGVLSLSNVRIGPSQCDEAHVASFVDAHLRKVLADGSLMYGIDVAQMYLGIGNLGIVLQTD